MPLTSRDIIAHTPPRGMIFGHPKKTCCLAYLPITGGMRNSSVHSSLLLEEKDRQESLFRHSGRSLSRLRKAQSMARVQTVRASAARESDRVTTHGYKNAPL